MISQKKPKFSWIDRHDIDKEWMTINDILSIERAQSLAEREIDRGYQSWLKVIKPDHLH